MATDAGFANIVYSAAGTGVSHQAAVSLGANSAYYWRVTAQNVCGAGTSTTFSFTTRSATMVCNSSVVDFEDGIPAGTAFADIPDDWECPDCGVSKADFEVMEAAA